MVSYRETAKLGVRRALQRGNVGIGRDPQMRRLTRTLDALEVTSVLDVGANVGQFAALLRSAGFRGRIDSFEPQPDAFATLAARASRDQHWRAHPFALGRTSGTASLYVSQNSYSSSLLPMTAAHLEAAPRSQVIGSVEVRVERLDDVTHQLQVEPRHAMVKIDAQGYESHVLEGGVAVMGEVAAVQLELSMVELYAGQQLFDDLRAVMADWSLDLWALEPGIADPRGRMLQCDGLFVRRGLL